MSFDRGDLNAQKTGISGTPVREEDFSLDPTGNWTDYVQKTSGTTDLDQDRTHNKVNEITAITATVGDDWTDPVHDLGGNMTTLPKPSSPTAGLTCQYDPWNRLSKRSGISRVDSGPLGFGDLPRKKQRRAAKDRPAALSKEVTDSSFRRFALRQ